MDPEVGGSESSGARYRAVSAGRLSKTFKPAFAHLASRIDDHHISRGGDVEGEVYQAVDSAPLRSGYMKQPASARTSRVEACVELMMVT